MMTMLMGNLGWIECQHKVFVNKLGWAGSTGVESGVDWKYTAGIAYRA